MQDEEEDPYASIYFNRLRSEQQVEKSRAIRQMSSLLVWNQETHGIEQMATKKLSEKLTDAVKKISAAKAFEENLSRKQSREAISLASSSSTINTTDGSSIDSSAPAETHV